jgi:hypothetical protein
MAEKEKIRVREKEPETQTVQVRPDPNISTTDILLSEKAKKLMAAAVPPSVRRSNESQEAEHP